MRTTTNIRIGGGIATIWDSMSGAKPWCWTWRDSEGCQCSSYEEAVREAELAADDAAQEMC